jgi:biopolymer transport protein ExbD
LAGKKKSKIRKPSETAPELNVMPFIDIFSMLNTFLLVSASFIGLGILEVQVPFLSNSPDVPDEPSRSLSIRVDVEESQTILTTQWTAEPFDKKVETYGMDDADIERLHQDLIRLRTAEPETDKVTLYSDDKVKYDKLVLIIDAIKTMKEDEPPLNLPVAKDSSDSANIKNRRGQFLYEKVVIGSVIL